VVVGEYDAGYSGVVLHPLHPCSRSAPTSGIGACNRVDYCSFSTRLRWNTNQSQSNALHSCTHLRKSLAKGDLVHRDATSDAPAWLAEVTARRARAGQLDDGAHLAVDLCGGAEFGADNGNVEEGAGGRRAARSSTSPCASRRLRRPSRASISPRSREVRRCSNADGPACAARSGLHRAGHAARSGSSAPSRWCARRAVQRRRAAFAIERDRPATASRSKAPRPRPRCDRAPNPPAHAFASAARGTLTARRSRARPHRSPFCPRLTGSAGRQRR
jgi:hypothetical protein